VPPIVPQAAAGVVIGAWVAGVSRWSSGRLADHEGVCRLRRVCPTPLGCRRPS